MAPSALRAIVPVALLLLVSFLPIAGSAHAAPAARAAVVPLALSWAYGANDSRTGTWTNVSGGFTATLTEFFGWHTILTQTTALDGTVQLETQRTQALDYWISFCKPTCSTPVTSGNVTFHAWQTQQGFANLTVDGAATVNGTSVPALALENVTDRMQANVTATAVGTLHGLLATRLTTYYFSVSASSSASVEFTPALGLVPVALAPGLSWNSSSEFSASGSWAASYSYLHVPIMGAPMHSGAPFSGAIAHSGIVSIFGTDIGTVVLDDGSATAAASLTVQGPFHLVDGVFLLPGNADVFDSGSSAWATFQNDSAAAATSSVNIGSHSPHIGLLASATSYAPSSSSPSSVGAITTASALPAAAPAGAAVVQAQPESVGAANQGSACLLAGTCAAPPTQPVGRAGAGGVGLLAVGLIAATIVAAAVVVERRRAGPPPTHPNERLYPTAAKNPSPPAHLVKAPAPPGSAPSEDPLGHLW